MVLGVFSVFDSAAVTYGRPFFMPARGVAVRTFTDEVNRPAVDNMMYQHPDDFTLYYLGTFDDNLGVFTLFESPELLVRAKDVALPEDKLRVVK